jgi:Fe-S oxidoreductase/electron transfer flavoprotein alpha/beta subunit/nitrate reductase gamma subunit
METRELFWSLGASGKAIFYAIAWMTIAIGLAGIAAHVAKYRRGRPLATRINIVDGLKHVALALLTHQPIGRRDLFAGMAHAGAFFGFVTLFVGTSIITLDDVVRPLFHVSFWKGTFFLWFSLTLDLGGLAAIIGLLAFIIRRATFNLPKLSYLRSYRGESELRPAARRWRREDWVFVLALLFILLSGFVQEAVRHAMERPAWAMWEPVGELFSRAILTLSPRPESIACVRVVNWWVHGLSALAFVAAIPWYKAKHMLAAFGSLYARDPKALARLPKSEPDVAAAGIAVVSDFTWKDMLDFDACTKCGRCHDVCPARATGFPLSPRDLILDLRVQSESSKCLPSNGLSLVGGVISQETLWACRMCGACQEVCPVGVEHPVKIVKMRRQLVEQRTMEPLLEAALTAIANTGNSFGENSRRRSAWTRELPFGVKDIRRESADNLWFVGDYASFDPRNQRVSRTFARLLHVARVDFGLLHEGERTAGNDVRRVGEEGLYESLVHHNQAAMAAAHRFAAIITTDPHSYNTIRNEYPEFGPTAPIRHYTEVLRELLESDRLKVTKPLGLRVTLHDPCHLGRLNKRYDDPRRVLELIGCVIVEMPRNRSNSFCCGAGGGRIWMSDPPGRKKPAQLRVEEAASIGQIDTFVTCCPKDLTMFEDARKTCGLEDAFVVEDIAELVARAVALETLQLHDVPHLVDQISRAVVERLDLRLQAIAAAVPQQPVKLPAGEDSETGTLLATSSGGRVVEPNLETHSPNPWRIAPMQAAAFAGYTVPAKTGYRLLVAVKHVAKLADDFQINDASHMIPSEFFDYQLNEFDDVALEQALKTAESLPGAEVVVVTVGPPEAEDTLRKALAKGANRGIRIRADDVSFGDPIAIARLLAGVAAVERPELVFCGVQSSDQAHAATGAAVARLLRVPCAAVVIASEWDGGDSIRVTRELEGGLRHEICVPVPAVITVQAGANTPRYATMKMLKQAKSKVIVDIDAAPEDAAPKGAAIAGLAMPSTRRATMLAGAPAETATEVLRLIREKTGGAA